MTSAGNAVCVNQSRSCVTLKSDEASVGVIAMFDNSSNSRDDSDDTSVDDVAFALVDLAVNCFLINIMAVFGTCGNIITLVVLAHHDVTHDTTNIFILALTVFDLLFCVTIPLRRIKCIVARFSPAHGETADTFAHLYVFIINRTFTVNGGLLVAAIGVERFTAVWCPFKVARIFTPHRVRIIVMAIVMVTATVFAPLLFALKYEWVYDETLEATVARLSLTDMYRENYDLINLIYFICFNILLWYVPFLGMVFFGTAIGIKVIQIGNTQRKLVNRADKGGKPSKNSRESTKGGARFDLKVIKMIGLVCLFSVLVFFLSVMLDAYSYFVPNFTYNSKLYLMMLFLNDLLFTVNSSCNFLIYASCSNKFSNTYRKVLSFLCLRIF